MNWTYQVYVNLEAFNSLPKSGKRRELVLLLMQNLAENYHLGGDIERTHPVTRRVIQISFISDFAITWWEDSPVKQIQVLDIYQIDSLTGFEI